MNQSPNRWEQALAGITVLIVVVTTIAGALLLALSDDPAVVGQRPPTATRIVLSTIALQTATITPSATLTPTATPTQAETATQTETTTATNTHQPTPRRPTHTPQPTATRGLPIATTGPGPTQTTTTTDGACSYPGSTIYEPLPGEILTDITPVVGTAVYPDFSFYKFEIRPRGSDSNDYLTAVTREQAKPNRSILWEFDTRAYPNGDYWLRLVVVDSTGNYPERCAILITIRN
ncbi:MAG: hypothetical protein ACFB51_05705 [Anaerolineae bacterium]